MVFHNTDGPGAAFLEAVSSAPPRIGFAAFAMADVVRFRWRNAVSLRCLSRSMNSSNGEVREEPITRLLLDYR